MVLQSITNISTKLLLLNLHHNTLFFLNMLSCSHIIISCIHVVLIIYSYQSATQNFRSKLSSANPPHLTYQVVNAKQQCFNATITLPIPAGSKTQIHPDQFWQKLQCESLQPNFRTTIQFKELVANRLQELWKDKNGNELLLGFPNERELNIKYMGYTMQPL